MVFMSVGIVVHIFLYPFVCLQKKDANQGLACKNVAP